MAGHFHQPHVVCPRCSHHIPLTEFIAAPLLEAERRKFQEKLLERETEFARKSDELRAQQTDLAKAKREAQLGAMVDSTVGMVGDLQGIVGRAMPEIAAIDEPPMLEGKAA